MAAITQIDRMTPTAVYEAKAPKNVTGLSAARTIADVEAEARKATGKTRGVLDMFVAILSDIAALPSGRAAIDELDIQLYRRACRGISTPAQLQSLREWLRASCEFRPIPDRLAEQVATIIGKDSEIDRLGRGEREAYKAIEWPPREVGAQKSIAGRSSADAIAAIRDRIKRGLAQDGAAPRSAQPEPAEAAE